MRLRRTAAEFAVSGGVAQAAVNAIKNLEPEREVKVMAAQGLRECKKMLMLAKSGKLNGYLLEGMACPGGCVGRRRHAAKPGKKHRRREQIQGHRRAQNLGRKPGTR